MSALRILVPVKRVIDYAVKPRVNKAQTAIETNGVKHSMNPFDELSIEESVRIPMAMGADRSLLVEMKDGEELEPLGVAKLLQKVVEKEKSNLVFLGKQSIDDDAGQTGQMLAGLLGWSQATQASKVVFKDGDIVEVTKEVDGGTDVVRGKLPMVITTDLRLNEPRYASLQSIMKAKKKKLEKSTLEPPPRQGGGKVDDVDGMISKLKELGAL
ncbi:electron transfer flavoprotein beta subunit [Botrytis cinerea]